MIYYDVLPEELPGTVKYPPLRLLHNKRGERFRATLAKLIEEDDGIGAQWFEDGILILPKVNCVFTNSSTTDNNIANLEKAKFVVLHDWYDEE